MCLIFYNQLVSLDIAISYVWASSLCEAEIPNMHACNMHDFFNFMLLYFIPFVTLVLHMIQIFLHKDSTQLNWQFVCQQFFKSFCFCAYFINEKGEYFSVKLNQESRSSDAIWTRLLISVLETTCLPCSEFFTVLIIPLFFIQMSNFLCGTISGFFIIFQGSCCCTLT